MAADGGFMEIIFDKKLWLDYSNTHKIASYQKLIEATQYLVHDGWLETQGSKFPGIFQKFNTKGKKFFKKIFSKIYIKIDNYLQFEN